MFNLNTVFIFASTNWSLEVHLAFIIAVHNLILFSISLIDIKFLGNLVGEIIATPNKIIRTI
ncbi:hypothetical protein SDC9_93727 [bioreactor metagenome]|uniref:Uncharacterized protein n=1 Tax=bioreactor metagenome TaxID=1076179 RepID=A0A645A1E6_9ZZZZ